MAFFQVLNLFFQRVKSLLFRAAVKLPGLRDVLIWAELVHGVMVFGSAGSGKTSAVYTWLVNYILSDPIKTGGVIPCVKSDERIRIEKQIRDLGRGDDLVIISKDSPFTFNALEYELYRKGKDDVEYNQALDLLMEIFLLGEQFQAGGESGGEQDRFWDKAMRRLLLRMMMLLVLSKEPVTMFNMRKILIDSFSEDDVERYGDVWQRIENSLGVEQEEAIKEYEVWCESNYFLFCFQKANTREDLNAADMDIMQLVGDYFLKSWPNLSEKTKSIVEESALGLFEPFMSGILKTHFSSTMSEEVRPERCFEEGAIILVDVPIKDYGIAAVYANGIVKKLFQLVVERRIIAQEENPRPCFLFCDEYHFLCSPQSDSSFQSSCRSVMCATIYITQSINNIKIAMGKTSADAKTKALLTNLGTQFFCANICQDTNTYASEMIGKTFIETKGSSFNTDQKGSQSTSEQLHDRIPKEHFQTLRTGGEIHSYKVDTILVCRGKKWESGEPFAEVTFDQRRGFKFSFLDRLKSYFI